MKERDAGLLSEMAAFEGSHDMEKEFGISYPSFPPARPDSPAIVSITRTGCWPRRPA